MHRSLVLPMFALSLACSGPSGGRESASLTTATDDAQTDETGTATDTSPDDQGDGDDPGDGEGDDLDDGDEADTSLKFDQASEDFGPSGCDPEQIPDTTSFSFVKTVDLGVDTLQAGFYDSTRDRVVVFSFFGDGKILDIEGNILDDVVAPPEALPQLDGGAYDLGSDLALLINQSCDLVEVNPETFQTEQVIPLGMAHGVSICAGLAIDPMGNLYVTSYGTDELVVLDRTGQLELFRVDMLGVGLPGFDGIAEIAGSDNFLVNSTTQLTAGIIAADGSVVVAPGLVGDAPIMGGGEVGQPDSMLTICTNGHTWVCDAYETTCSDFAPSDGDKMACGCLLVG